MKYKTTTTIIKINNFVIRDAGYRAELPEFNSGSPTE